MERAKGNRRSVREPRSREKEGVSSMLGLAIGIVLLVGGAGLVAYDVSNLVFQGDGHQWLMWAEALMLFFGFITLWLWAEASEDATAEMMANGKRRGAGVGAGPSPSAEGGSAWGGMDLTARIEALKAAGFSGPLAIRWTAFDFDELPTDVREAIGIGPGGGEG